MSRDQVKQMKDICARRVQQRDDLAKGLECTNEQYSTLLREAEGILRAAGYPDSILELMLSPLWPRKRLRHAEEELTRGL